MFRIVKKTIKETEKIILNILIKFSVITAIYVLYMLGFAAAFSPLVLILISVKEEGLGANIPSLVLLWYLIFMVAIIWEIRNVRFRRLGLWSRCGLGQPKKLIKLEWVFISMVTVILFIFLGEPTYMFTRKLIDNGIGFNIPTIYIILLVFLVYSVVQGLRYGLIQFPESLREEGQKISFEEIAAMMRHAFREGVVERLLAHLIFSIIIIAIIAVLNYLQVLGIK